VMIQRYTILNHIPNSMWNTLSISALSEYTLYNSKPLFSAHFFSLSYCRQSLRGSVRQFGFGEYMFSTVYVATFIFLSPADDIILDGRTRNPFPLKSPGVQMWGWVGLLLIYIEKLIFLSFSFFLYNFLGRIH
jgi:hypothetical protein